MAAKKKPKAKSSSREKERAESGSAVRALWSGSLNLALISIPVRLVTALKDTGVHFHRVTPDGGCRLRQRLFCPDTGKEYDFGDTARGYEIAPDQYVIVDDEELAALRPEGGHNFEIEQFVELAEIDPVYFDRPYYLVADKKGEKAYELLRQVLQGSSRAALGKFWFHEKEYISLVRADEHVLRIQTLRYTDQIVPATAVSKDLSVKISAQERKLAEELIDSLTKPFHPRELVDHSKDELKKLLEKKKDRKGAVHTEPEKKAAKGSTNVVDLISRLKASMKKKEESEKASAKPRAKARAGGRR